MPHENSMVITFEFPDQPIDLVIHLLDNPGVQSWANSVLSVPRTAQGFISSNTVPRRYNQEVIETHLEICVKEVKSLNDAIHAIEVYLPADIDYEPDFSFDEIYCSEEPAFDDPGWWKMDNAHRQYHSPQHASVIFGPQILGKSIIRSYLDGDNPNDWDTTGHHSNNGSLLIQVSDFRQRVYNSDSFKQWLARWGMAPEQVIYDYPVGAIQDQDLVQIIHKKLQGNKRVNTTYKKLH